MEINAWNKVSKAHGGVGKLVNATNTPKRTEIRLRMCEGSAHSDQIFKYLFKYRIRVDFGCFYVGHFAKWGKKHRRFIARHGVGHIEGLGHHVGPEWAGKSVMAYGIGDAKRTALTIKPADRETFRYIWRKN